ncbi:TATA element modulatory factor [Phlebotomus argentipes]|uniref:TATA element modulatory factor n=1 Tax=Phlebotomus argentipes TaxID=94469 RepID=UPI0028938099|nr:TATA element modulatory factor [Phlebotomus argentipes]
MSWFDTAGLANLAKTALKEAQKQIDKALDIKDDDVRAELTTDKPKASSPLVLSDKGKKTAGGKGEGASRTAPTTPSIGNVKDSASFWGSFSGSFFDAPGQEVQETVTTPPTSTHKFPLRDEHTSESEIGVISRDGGSSDSVELISSPGSTGNTMGQSDSVEVLGMDTPSEASSIFVVASNVTTPSSEIRESVLKIIPVEGTDVSEEEVSVDEDSMSYNTVSDSLAVTVLEPTDKTDSAIITVPPSRQSFHLSLSSTSSKLMLSEGSTCDTEDSNESEQTVTLGEEKASTSLVSTALEDAAIENYEMQTEFSDSTQSFEEVLPMTQKSMSEPSRKSSSRQSSNSSDGKGELVKLPGDQTSGHTSGDEVETTTSSDIEIISNPNGDSSSTNSVYRASPMKDTVVKYHTDFAGVKIKGHCREASAASSQSVGSDELTNPSEIEKLQRRVSELSELLEKREYKLVELGRQNAELQEKNAEILAQTSKSQYRPDSVDISNVTEEYTQRLSALEKKFQQSIRERDTLRDQVKGLKQDLGGCIPKAEAEKRIAEKESIADELKVEGEKLSRQILQHSNITKKLRAKEKEMDELVKNQKEQIEEHQEELERLKKSLSAKEEVERSQIEAVHRLSSEKRKLEKENGQLKSELDDTTQKLKTVQTSLEAAKTELTEKRSAFSELKRKTESLETLTSEKQLQQSQNNQMVRELEDLREKLRLADAANTQREQKLREENTDLMRRLEESDRRAEEQAQALSTATIPLVQQLESLQKTLNTRTATWERQEQKLLEKLETLQNIETTSTEETTRLRATVKRLEEQLSASLLESSRVSTTLEEKEIANALKVSELTRRVQSLEKDSESLRENNSVMERQLQTERENLQVEKRRVNKLMQELQTKQLMAKDDVPDAEHSTTRHELGGQTSPALSLERVSLDESVSSNAWQFQEDVECMSNAGRPSGGSFYGGGVYTLGGHTSVLENLQSTLKQRDGELYQLQWELSRSQTEKGELINEISDMTVQIENMESQLENTRSMEERFVELRTQYDALLEMYGEKEEEAQELRLDLQDVKEMYKVQIDDLLRQQKSSS